MGDAARDIERRIERISYDTVPSDTVSLARFLLGKVLVREFAGRSAAGRIVETEAYLQHDPACHGFRGVTPRNRSLFLERGHAYVYLCYGTSYLLNVSSEAAGIGTGVLLRALEPLCGTEHMRIKTKPINSIDLMRGPGRLTAALRVDLRHDGLNLFTAPQLWIGSDNQEVGPVGCSVRIGISKAAAEPLRFFVAGSRHVSGPRKLNV
ncbi:MAG: DNA-3-methyladenine glycosylase [Steroidobacteraceae bacterium]